MNHETMSSSNFSLDIDSLLMINRGEGIEAFSKEVVDSLELLEYILVIDDEIIITQMGLNVLEYYMRNREYVSTGTPEMLESLVHLTHYET
jgi:hypothetical protein